MDLCSVRKNGILEVDSVRDDVVVLVHPKNGSRCDRANSGAQARVSKAANGQASLPVSTQGKWENKINGASLCTFNGASCE